jgi:hypothetical protein
LRSLILTSLRWGDEGGSNPVIATSPGEGARFPNLQTKGENKKNKKGKKKE